MPCSGLLPIDSHNNLSCWVINLLLDVWLCNIAANFYSLFYDTTRKNTTQQNV